jgi:hypothetical protein
VDFTEGIAAAFTAAAALLNRIRAGDTDCPFEPPGGDCPLARPVVEAVIDWGRTGTPRPLPVRELVALVQQQVATPRPIDPAHPSRAVEWAATPVLQGASC